jgi:hypothetical protein
LSASGERPKSAASRTSAKMPVVLPSFMLRVRII